MRIAKKIISTTVTILIFAVIGALFFRIWSADYCPKSMKHLHFTETLSEKYREAPESFEAFRQDIRIQYDDSKEGYFFALNTVLVPSADALQTSVRYNDVLFETLEQEYGFAPDMDKKDMFIYSAFACTGSDGEEGYSGVEYEPSEIVYDDFWMYTYAKLCFDDIDLDGVYWVRIDIYLNNEEKTRLGSLAVYENNERYNELEKIKISKSELPK